MRKISTQNKAEEVDKFMNELIHPLKAEVQTVRDLIKSADSNITEQIKWNAPSFSYKGEYLVTFNLREIGRIHLVFHNPRIPNVKSSLLEGDYADRRIMYLSDGKDVEAKGNLLVEAIRDLIHLIDS